MKTIYKIIFLLVILRCPKKLIILNTKLSMVHALGFAVAGAVSPPGMFRIISESPERKLNSDIN
ncbi:hypothetical protein BpHYR1_041183 [Brachionus plicatilis]|uniref:Uncharacterized protein n=1 Tax=Brachionus plicatilis TaxID=10195 RepID=A0A3M7PXD2_BRAPC|nr:hypothetical protein BpHYR1_041183 [Brachionus plicatilis]